MNYQLMATEYTNEANKLKTYLEKLKKYYTSRLKHNNFTPGYSNIDFRVKKLYDMYLETASIGRYLSNLAKNSDKNFDEKKVDAA